MSRRTLFFISWLLFVVSSPLAAQPLPFSFHVQAPTNEGETPRLFAQFLPKNAHISSGSFDFYVLSLSWSPSFCQLKAQGESWDENKRIAKQCSSDGLQKVRERKGFVLHGLWPQREQERDLAYCGAVNRPISAEAMAQALAIFPDDGLARYQWRKHGSCSGEAPSGYFSQASQALARIKWPDLLALAQKGDGVKGRRIARIAIEAAFVQANPNLRKEAMMVVCKGQVFTEIRVCFQKDVRDFYPCQELKQKACRAPDLWLPEIEAQEP